MPAAIHAPTAQLAAGIPASSMTPNGAALIGPTGSFCGAPKAGWIGSQRDGSKVIGRGGNRKRIGTVTRAAHASSVCAAPGKTLLMKFASL